MFDRSVSGTKGVRMERDGARWREWWIRGGREASERVSEGGREWLKVKKRVEKEGGMRRRAVQQTEVSGHFLVHLECFLSLAYQREKARSFFHLPLSSPSLP